MVAILTPWTKRAQPPNGRQRPARGRPLSRDLLILYQGHHDVECASGIVPVRTGVTKTTGLKGRSNTFAGGAEGTSDLNFGVVAGTVRSHIDQPTTWAFLATSHVIAETALACQTDLNNDRGWQIGYVTSGVVVGIGVTFVGSSGNLRSNISPVPATDTLYTYVCTYDGVSPDSTHLAMYLNGVSYAPAFDSGPTGTTGTIVDPMYIGRRRFDTALSHNGDIVLAAIAQRAWTDAEVKSFHDNPWQLFEPVRNTPYSFLGPGVTGNTYNIISPTFRTTLID